MTRLPLLLCLIQVCLFTPAPQAAGSIKLTVHADRIQHRISPYLTGACIEDVNHEIYGGIDSQMIFGESFEEPPPGRGIQGFTVIDGAWSVADGKLQGTAGPGHKIISSRPPYRDGITRVEVRFNAESGGNAGLILSVLDARPGADSFTGYEISLDTSGRLVLGRHRNNWEPIREVACEVPLSRWIPLAVHRTGATFQIYVSHRLLLEYTDRDHTLATGSVGLRTWQRPAEFRGLVVEESGTEHRLPFALDPLQAPSVSAAWRAVATGDVHADFMLDTEQPFSGTQNQTINFISGSGIAGVSNSGLNHWGMNWVKDKPYEGELWVRSAKPTPFSVALENADGSRRYAETRLHSSGSGWNHLQFQLTPSNMDTNGRFTVTLDQPGSLTLGYAHLQPGSWARFNNLPTRKDIAEELIAQGITVLRQGGCMANAEGYRWKNMIGPRHSRPPYKGWWYPHSSNGWGILDFLNLCESAGFLGIPDFNMGESPEDMADFVEYATGPTHTVWGARRAADGHPAPYRLPYLQLGNEERVDDAYWRKFEPIAKAVWSRDPNVILVVGDFAYYEPVTDPDHVTGAASRIPNLDTHRKILQLAREHNREVWFDVHVGTDGPRPDGSLQGAISFVDALASIAEGARHRVVVFELNANNPTQRRALANAIAIQTIARDGRIPIVTSANCLQPDGQNDNGWNQGLLFLNPTRTWLQPPGHVTRMFSRHYQPRLVATELSGSTDDLDICATLSDDNSRLVIQIVSLSAEKTVLDLELGGFEPKQPNARLEVLAAPLGAANSADNPARVQPVQSNRPHQLNQGRTHLDIPPHSISVVTFE